MGAEGGERIRGYARRWRGIGPKMVEKIKRSQLESEWGRRGRGTSRDRDGNVK